MSTAPASAPRRLLVIYNPIAGGRKAARFERVREALEAAGANVTVRATGKRGDAEALARDAGPEFDAVIAAGGDGTINEVVNALATRTATDAPPLLGLIPLGTVNVLARELSYPHEPGALARLLARGSARALYLGEANGRLFSLMAGVGFDARIVARIDPATKRRFGRGAYIWQILRELVSLSPHRYAVSLDGAPPIDAASVIVAKSRLYAGSFELARAASVSEPRLHACLFERGGRLHALLYLLALPLGMISSVPGFRVAEAARIVIAAPAGEPVQADGDTTCTTPVTVSLHPIALRVIAP